MNVIGTAAALVLVAGPLLLGLAGAIRARGRPAEASPGPRWSWRPALVSALLYVVAFNLTFFIQELFLVLPKAFTPGLEPTLFHNNHRWEGEHPLASLFQGTGALAILICGIACALALRLGWGRSSTVRLFLFWMAYNGFFQSVVVGAVHPANDVGMAMDYLQLGPTARTAAALVALAAIPPIGLRLTRTLLGFAGDAVSLAGGGGRSRVVFRVATLPALLAIPAIVLYRVPRELIEVVLPPVVVTAIGTAWLQATAWWVGAARPEVGPEPGPVAYPAVAALLLLLFFHVLLRPGVAF